MSFLDFGDVGDVGSNLTLTPDVGGIASDGLNTIATDTSGLFSDVGSVFNPGSLVASAAPTVSGASLSSATGALVNDITKTITNFYDDVAKVNQAQGNAALVKAQAANAVKAAGAGIPSSYFLLGGAGLLAVLFITKAK